MPTKNELNRLLWASNRVVMSFGQAPLYAPEDHPSAKIQRGNAGGRSRGLRGGRGFSKGPTRVNTKDEAQFDCSSHFHVSLGWSLEEPSLEMVNRTKSAAILAMVKTLTTELVTGFEAVKVKVGNAVTVVPLPTKVKEGTGLIGL
jgi:U6 snRNA phosphodiesterase